MRFEGFRIVICEDKGAGFFDTFCKYWNSIKEIDSTYRGPLHYWDFYQMGDFDDVDVSIVKFELWSAWRVPEEPDVVNGGAFIGANTLLCFYKPEKDESFSRIKDFIEMHLEKRRSTEVPLIVYCLNVESRDRIPAEHIEYFESVNAIVNPVREIILRKKTSQILPKIFRGFAKLLIAEIPKKVNIDGNWWHLSLEDLRFILESLRNGKVFKPRKMVEGQRLKLYTEAELYRLKHGITEGSVAGSATTAGPSTISGTSGAAESGTAESASRSGYSIRKLTEADLTEEDLKHVAIGPNGEIIPRMELEKKNDDEILELVKEGFKLPDWVVIPRHCPRCFNQNQKSIREVDDPDVILMQRPRIYGRKYICGMCGYEWKKTPS